MIVTEIEYLKRLSFKPSEYLASSLGYRGRSRWIQIYYEWGVVDKPICFDGKRVYFGSRVAWELLVQSVPFTTQCLYLSNQHNCLLLDRRYRILYGGDKEQISRLFKDPDGFKFLEPTGISNRQDYFPKFKESLALFMRGASFSAGVIIVIAIAGKLMMYRDVKEIPLEQTMYVNCQKQLNVTQDLLNEEIKDHNEDIKKLNEDSHDDRAMTAPPK